MGIVASGELQMVSDSLELEWWAAVNNWPVVRVRVGPREKQYVLLTTEPSFHPKIMFSSIKGFSLFMQKSPQNNHDSKTKQAPLDMRFRQWNSGTF